MSESLELKLSFFVCFFLGAVYVAYALLAEESGGQPFGHGLGIIGMGLMLITETFYSLRKRVSWLRWAGPLRFWLSFHIFTGITGPFLALMHTAFRFRGLAGFSMAMSVLVAASGFLGRYFYVSIPRSIAGAEASAAELAAEIERVQAALAAVAAQRSGAVRELIEADAKRKRVRRGDVWLVLLRAWDEWNYRRRLHARIRQLEKIERAGLNDVERMLTRRRNLERQARTLESARRLLSLWHVAHVPMGLVLFGSIAIHVAATLYFRAGLWR